MRERQLDRHIRVDNNDTPLSDDTSVRTGFTGQINIALHKKIDSVRKNPFPEGIDIGDFPGYEEIKSNMNAYLCPKA